MRLLIKPFSRFRKKKRSRYSSMPEVLTRYLSKTQLAEVLAKTPDRRFLIAGAAKILEISEADLAAEIARRLNLQFLARVEAMDVALLGKRSLAELRHMGAIMATNTGRIRAIICVDPWQVEQLITDLPGMPVYLSTWYEIASALDRSENEYLEQKKSQDQSRQEKLKQTASQVLSIIVQEAQQFQRERLLIAFESDQIEYSFTTSEGRSAVGTIAEQIRPALLDLLQQVLAQPEHELELQNTEGEAVSVAVEKLNGQQVFGISWGGGKPVAATCSDGSDSNKEQVVPFPTKEQKPKTSGRAGRRKKQVKRQEQAVLVVEDNVTFAKVLERFLEKQKVKVEHVPNGKEALEYLAKNGNSIDLAVCDVHMPEMNGFQFLQKLRELPEYFSLPVIMLTSDEDLETELRALGDGADAFVPKSRDPRLLCAHIERQLRKLRGS